MRRLVFQIYLTVVGILLLFAVLVSVVWLIHPKTPFEREFETALGETAADLLPGADRGPEELQAALERFGQQILQLASLVATHCRADFIVALDKVI